MTTQAFITPEVLRWARERSHLTLEEAADKAAVKADQLANWERSGNARPSFRQAQKLAHVLHIPFGYLFLSSPPVERPALPDLRTVADNRRNSFSADFLDLLNDVMRKQQWYRETLEEESAERLQFIGRFHADHNENQIAQDISQTLGINDSFRTEANSWEAFLTNLIERVESIRVLVLRSGIVRNDTHRKLSVEEFRGFAVNDDLAPLIFLNGQDSKAAQIFTLAHELAHLWIGEGGISNPDLGSRRLSENLPVERFCNQVAAEVLVPQRSFLNEWHNSQHIRENVSRLNRHYRVSSLVILRRAFDLQKITWEQYNTLYRAELERLSEREVRQQSEGGNFYATLGVRNSKQLTKVVVSAAFEGRLLYRDAARLLGVKIQKLERVAVEFQIR